MPSTESSSNASRRTFLAASATSAVATLATPPAYGVHAGGDNRLRVGVIGCGGRGKGACSDAIEAGDDVVIVAMADAFEDNLEAAYGSLANKFSARLDCPKERRFHGFDAYKQVLASDIDLVILATPPGFRPIHFRAAVDAGKHVFMEKPVAVDPAGIRIVMDAARDAKDLGLGVGVGLQRRHNATYIESIQRIWDGALGSDMLYSRVYWNGGGVWTRPRKPEQTEMEYQMRNWYYFTWLCGDHIIEQHIHNLDVSNWIKQGHPVKANGMGGREVRTGKDHGQIYDHHAVEYTYADGSTMMSQCRHQPGTWSQVSEYAHGATGFCHPNSGKFYDGTGKVIDRVRAKGKRDYVQEHIDLQNSIKQGTPLAEGETGAVATMTALLGRMATYSGKVVEWDEAIQSNLDLSPARYAFDATPPAVPNAEGRYPVPIPGV